MCGNSKRKWPCGSTELREAKGLNVRYRKRVANADAKIKRAASKLAALEGDLRKALGRSFLRWEKD
jgi:hypothetical protein